jgi:uncharacterized protein (TIRG00374 family)
MKSLLSNKSLLVSALVFALLVLVLAFFVDWQTVLSQISQANLGYLAVASVLLVIGYVAYAIRWRLLLHDKPGFAPTFHASNAGNMVNTLLPLRPGDAARIFMLGKKEELPLIEVTSSIVVERWFEQIMRLAALGGAIVFGAGAAVSLVSILGSTAFLAASLLFMIWIVQRRESVLDKYPRWLARLPRITEEQARHGLATLIDGLASMASVRKVFAALAWSVITWTFFWGFHYLCLASLHQDLDIQTQLALSLGSLALVPPSATTLPGVYQVSMVVPLSLVGYDASLLTSYALLMNITSLVWVMGLGLWGTLWAGVEARQLFEKAEKPTESS